MADDDGVLAGIVGAFGVALVAVGLYLAHAQDAFDTPTLAAMTAPSVVPVPAATASDSGVDILVDRARAAVARRDFATAQGLLEQAERLDARDPDVQQARAEISGAKGTPVR